MGTMLFIAFIVSISLLIYYSITRDQKVFVDKVSIIDDAGNDFRGHTEMGLRTLRLSKVSLFKIFTQIGVAEELSRSLVAAGYSVTEQMPKSSLVKKIMIGVAMVKAVY